MHSPVNSEARLPDTCEGGSAFIESKITSASAQPSASATAAVTTRRDADSAASSGTAISQIAANEEMPPVCTDTANTKAARETDERMCAISNRPVRDKNQ